MRIRTYVGILLGVVAIVGLSFLTTLNRGLLAAPFQLGPEASIPLYAAFLLVFLLGFLPPAAVLLGQTLKRRSGRRATPRAENRAEKKAGAES